MLRKCWRALPAQPGVEYSALVPNLRGFQRAAAAGVKRVELTLSATDSHNINNMNMTTEQSIKMIEQCLNSGLDVDLIVGLAVTFGCPFEGVPPFSRLKFVLDQLSAMGIKAVGLGDTSGVATPLQVYNTTSRLLDAYPDINFFFHPHNTHGNAMANVFAAMQAGITHFDSSVAGLGGCPYAPGASGNIATEDLVDTMNEMDIETGIDIDRLLDTARFVREAFGHSDSATLRAARSRTFRSRARTTSATVEAEKGTAMQTRQQVFCEIKDHIMLIRVDNPETKNGLDWDGIEQLARSYEELQNNPDVRVGIITGNEQYFYTGAAWTPTPRARKTSIPTP